MLAKATSVQPDTLIKQIQGSGGRPVDSRGGLNNDDGKGQEQDEQAFNSDRVLNSTGTGRERYNIDYKGHTDTVESQMNCENPQRQRQQKFNAGK